MTRILIVYAHPYPKSFNHSIKEEAVQAAESAGHEVRVRDLYEMKFDPVLTEAHLAGMKDEQLTPEVLEEQKQVSWAEVLIFIYPIWWWERPAILKGWFDLVMTHGFAFQSRKKVAPFGLLNEKKAIVITTLGESEEKMVPDAANAIEDVMRVGTLQFCGITDVSFMTYYSMGSREESEKAKILEEIRSAVSAL